MALLDDAVNKVGGSLNLQGIGSTITWVIVLFILLVASGVIVYFLIQRKSFNVQIRIFENIAGRGYMHTKNDTAKLVKVADDGSQILYLRKHKVYRQGYGRKIGTNTFAFAIGSDGLWYNVVFGDLDKALHEIGLVPVDKDIRLANVVMRKSLEKEYNKKNFLEKYGAVIAFASLIIMLGIATWLGTWNQVKAADAVNAALSGTKDLTVQNQQMLAESQKSLDASNSAMRALADALNRNGINLATQGSTGQLVQK